MGDRQSAAEDDRIEHLFAAARHLEGSGRTDEARAAYLALLSEAPTHLGALTNLGTLLYETGYRSAARTAYEEAVRQHPDSARARVNLANLLAAIGEAAAARQHYERALGLAPDLAEAHRGMANLLAELGEEAIAAEHRHRAYAGRPATPQRYRGTGPGIPLLLLVSARGGNVPTRTLIDDRVFRVTALAADYADHAAPLPPHDLIVNAIGDADLTPEALDAAGRLVQRSPAPIVNRPEAVRETGRMAVARRLGDLAGLRVPRILPVPRERLAAPDGADLLAAHGLAPPVLLRSPGFHTGRHFVRVETAAELAAAAAALPGAAALAIETLPARGADGLARKYRVMIVDGALYPLHLAVSADWKVHYFSSAMAEDAVHRAEEAAFLADMAGIVGERGMAALAAIAARLGLDYGGIDFGLSASGEVLLFEANATMVVNPPEADPRWDYRREPVARILAAVRRMLDKHARTTKTSSAHRST